MNKFEIENLELYYGDFKALKNINMNISPNEITAFIGPSGCGKSTLLKTLDRMNDLVDTCKINGSVKYDGKDIYSYDINELRKNVAMVFQKPNPFAMSIYDNVAYGPKTHGIRSKKELDEIVEKSLRQAALWDEVGDKLKKSALALSGGQQQRLCIARTLAVNPDVILMDEPTSALDPISTSKIEELALELKKDYTIIIVTHSMQQAKRISNKTAFFLLGEVIEFDETEKLFQTRLMNAQMHTLTADSDKKQPLVSVKPTGGLLFDLFFKKIVIFKHFYKFFNISFRRFCIDIILAYYFFNNLVNRRFVC